MDYTFANFVVGSSNQFAYTAARAVAQTPARAYNPLVLCGGPGLGKTHLLRAIGQQIRQQHPAWQVRDVSAEQFMHELLQAMQYKRMEAFRTRYRQVDVLLVDDVHVFAGRTRMQAALLHTFDALYDAGRQLVLASEKTPQDITPLQSRLRSRLTSGIIADLQLPDLDTRLAILQRKADERGLTLSQPVALCLATHLRTHMRDLENGLVRLATYASLHNRPMDEAMTTLVLEQFLAAPSQALTTPRIQQTVAEYFGLTAHDLQAKSRQRTIAFPRQIAMFLCRECTNASLPEIGRDFGGRDATTVLYACGKIARLEEADAQVARLLWQFRRALEC